MSEMAGLDGVAKKQHGLITRQQATNAGLSTASIRWRCDNGELERVHRDVFRFRAAPETWEQRALAVTLQAGERALLSHATAGVLHRLEGVVGPPHIDVSLPYRDRREAPSGSLLHLTRHHLGNTFTIRGLPVTNLARTLIDLSGVLSPAALEFALDSAHRRCASLASWIEHTAKTFPRRGVRGLSTLLDFLELRTRGGTESLLEMKVWRRLRRAPFPAPARQYVVNHGSEYVMRVDFAWPAQRIALHADSFTWHHQRERLERDARQRTRLQALGWRNVVVTDRQVDDAAWLDDVKLLLETQYRLPLAA